eukprot:CAMPEP_0170500166 /NCGR_PEP_ID=MMETSP0208-20121228/33951_1 /TAXON_ID=197538 /ORGANISM="Strombidium inclinatum, Strain S3" /LENGTH=87 /DNA_ID=CAMNT_0010778075 /DNA_START=698 /DNA_END=961 /DNA_ORIENTATION=-
MLHYNPAKRPSASECLQYSFFQVAVPIPINAPAVQDCEASQMLEELGLDDTVSSMKKMDPFKASIRDEQRQNLLKFEREQASNPSNA